MKVASNLPNNQRPVSFWVLFAIFIMVLVGIPIYTILAGLWKGPGPYWPHLSRYLLGDYILNSFLLVVGTGLLSLVWGVPAAWCVSTLSFRGRKILEWLLILPLTIPTYIMAFTYAGIFDYTGGLQTGIREIFKVNLAGYLDILNIYGVMLVMSFALFPYVYIITRAAFLTQYRSLIEASQTLGASTSRCFFKVVLPVARPALVAGVTLVVMEVLNDYGAVKYFGVRTFTTGIFRSWFSFEDPQAAIYLSSILLLFVFVVVLFEKRQRGEAKYSSTVIAERPLLKKPVRGAWEGLAILITGLPVFLGFVLPLIQLIWWAIISHGSVGYQNLGPMVLNSFLLALAASLSCATVALLLLFAARLRNSNLFNWGMKLSTMGYAIPGAVVAIGVMIPFLFIDKKLILMFQHWVGSNPGLILTGTVVGLLFAYTVRFLAVAFNPIESGFARIGNSLEEVARSLRAGPFKRLTSINIPLLTGALVSATLLVFVDVLKELPLTLILRPFNFNTLATRSFELASDELVAAAAAPSLIIIITGLLPIYLLNVLITKRKWV